eukprot:9383722-Alexandrium_andersonii.AAC.1
MVSALLGSIVARLSGPTCRTDASGVQLFTPGSFCAAPYAVVTAILLAPRGVTTAPLPGGWRSEHGQFSYL